MMAQHNILNAGLKALCFFRGSGPVLLRNPIFFCHFPRGGGESGPLPPPPPLDPHMVKISFCCYIASEAILKAVLQ